MLNILEFLFLDKLICHYIAKSMIIWGWELIKSFFICMLNRDTLIFQLKSPFLLNFNSNSNTVRDCSLLVIYLSYPDRDIIN